MKNLWLTNSGLFTLMMLLIASCMVTKRYEQPDDKLAGDLFRGVQNTDTVTLASLPYYEIFRDDLLRQFIEEGITNNLDLKVAYTRIQQAEAYYRQSKAAYFPSLDAETQYNYVRVPEGQALRIPNNTSQYQLSLISNWELDIWGRLRSAQRAQFAELLSTEAGMRAVQTSIVSLIANNYFLLLALDEQVSITEQTVYNWDTTVTTMRALKESSVVTEAAVVQSEAQRYAAEVTLPDLKQYILETENALSILLGRPPGPIERNQLNDQEFIDELATGIPLQLLANRPDVQQAEYAYRNAFELTNVARTAFYPSLSITGSAGLSSLSAASLLNLNAFAANVGASLLQPITNRRLIRTNFAVARAQQQATLFEFENSLLTAGQEVSNALSLHAAAVDKMEVRSNQINALQLSVEYTQELLRNGFANYNEVITARQSLLAAELGSVDDKLQRLQASVNLYRALGGGWK